MLTVSLKINPFTNEVSVQKDGKPIKPTNRLSGFYKSFINTALNLKEIILEDENVKIELDSVLDKLNNIPIYCDYLRYLDKVNQMISYVNDEMNDYFYKLLNE